MSRLDISLLGTIEVRLDGQPRTGRAYAKVLALLAWLAVEADRPHQRALLASLLWPDQTEEKARHSLRQALSTLRRMLDTGEDGAEVLTVTRETIAFVPGERCRVDVGEVTRLIAATETHDHLRIDRCPPCIQRLQRAVSLYRGDFLQGFSIDDSASFDDWAQVWRERLRAQVLTVHGHIAAWEMERGATGAAIAAVRAQLTLDPLQEAAHRQLMTLLVQEGKRGEALAQYERCRALLAEELGVEPEPETEALHARLLRPEEAPARTPARTARVASARPLPAPVTALVGRERELEEIEELLAQRGCRLLTLLGLGGSGKTRLAIELATRQAQRHAGTVAFVPLAGVGDAQQVAPAIADTLGVRLFGSELPERQLMEWLRDREVLLVLDNLEHLVGDLRIVGSLLSAAPGLRVIATSRERLNLQGEWVVPVEGLAVPYGDATDAFEGYGAVELFRERLRQARWHMPLRHEERPAVARICQLVEGIPLAIELAAAWAPTLALEQIADEIQRNLDFLSTSMEDIPDRHRSLRAVFTHSWALLDADERRAFRRLAVFRGGFDTSAAEAVAGTTAFEIAGLVAKSLIAQRESGRYVMHELVRQFAEEQLLADPAEAADVREAHGAYYLELLAGHEEALTGRDQRNALAAIERDGENIMVAWSRAIAAGEYPLVCAAMHAMWLSYVIRGQMREAAGAFGQVLEALDRDGTPEEERPRYARLARAMAMTRCGGFRSGLGRYDEAIALLEDGIARLRELRRLREVGLALNMLAAVQHITGDLPRARALLEESLEAFRSVDDAWGVAFSLNDLGLTAFLLEEDIDAERYCQESHTMFRDIGDQRGQAFAAYNLGMIAARRGDLAAARARYEESLELRAGRHDRWGVAASMVQLASVLHRVGAQAEARAMLREALGIAWDSSVTPVVLEALVALMAVELESGAPDGAPEVLAAVAAHPATPGPVRRQAEAMLPVAVTPGVDARPAGPAWAIRTVDDITRRLVS